MSRGKQPRLINKVLKILLNLVKIKKENKIRLQTSYILKKTLQFIFSILFFTLNVTDIKKVLPNF